VPDPPELGTSVVPPSFPELLIITVFALS